MSNETACVTRRTKGDGTIFQNKKGRWIARYKRKGFPPKEFSGKTRAEAQAKMDEYKFLVLSGNLVIICCLLKNMQLNSLTTKVSR